MIRTLFRAYIARLLFRRLGSCLLPVILVVAALILLIFRAA